MISVACAARLEPSLNPAYDLLKGAISMAHSKLPASEAATGKCGAAAKSRAKSAPAATAKTRSAALVALAVYRASPLERIAMIRRGIPASEAKRLFAELRIGQGAGFKALRFPQSSPRNQ
jgi:hypothetical protein